VIIGAAGLSAPLLLPMFGMMLPGEIIPQWWAASSRNGGRDQPAPPMSALRQAQAARATGIAWRNSRAAKCGLVSLASAQFLYPFSNIRELNIGLRGISKPWRETGVPCAPGGLYCEIHGLTAACAREHRVNFPGVRADSSSANSTHGR
jgi:hypothetical protein